MHHYHAPTPTCACQNASCDPDSMSAPDQMSCYPQPWIDAASPCLHRVQIIQQPKQPQRKTHMNERRQTFKGIGGRVSTEGNNQNKETKRETVQTETKQNKTKRIPARSLVCVGASPSTTQKKQPKQSINQSRTLTMLHKCIQHCLALGQSPLQ